VVINSYQTGRPSVGEATVAITSLRIASRVKRI